MSSGPKLENLNLAPQQQPVEASLHFNPTVPNPPQVLGGDSPAGLQDNLTVGTTPLSSGDTDSSLVLLPEVAATGRPTGSRRPFQRRRRSRACDACRARKTKCDTPDQGPCSACAAASLVCKFSEGGEDRRRAGPARRIRTLEAQLQELTKKLRDAEALLGGSAVTKRSVSPSNCSSPQFPCSSSSVTGSTIGHPHAENTPEWWRPPNADSGAPSTTDHFRGGMPFGSAGYNPQPPVGTEMVAAPRAASWSRGVFDSNPPFVASYKAYLRHLGYPASSSEYPSAEQSQQQTVHGDQPPPRVPLLSEYPSIVASKTLPLDLRVFLPPKPFAGRLREVFRRTIQNYTPLFYWPVFLEEKFDRAWASPMWEEDTAVVKSVFCILQMVLAVASQMVEEVESSELGEMSGSSGDMQERAGWKFFHLGRRYADLNSPAYSADDAMFLLLMSIYLDNASLPSPCWMITGAMARVCQDVVLDKNPPPNILSEVELESRRRLFWAAYIQERKECLKKGRAVIMNDSDVEVPLPQILANEDRLGTGTLAGEGGGDDNQLPPDLSGCVPSNNPLTAEQSLQVMTTQIHISMLCSTLMTVRVSDNGGPQDLQRIQDFDHKLKRAWDGFPSHLTDLQNVDPLDMGAIRPLFYLQYCRLLLYRFFTEPTLNPDFRTFCLEQSIQVSKISAHLIFRASRNNAYFDRCFGMRTEELTHLQTLRTAVILLIGYCTRHEPALLSVSKEEVETCIRALRSIAAFHARGRRLLTVFEEFARSFGYESSQAPAPSVPPNTKTATPVEVKREIPTTTASIELIPPQPLQWEFGQNYSHTNTPPSTAPLFGAQYVPASDWPDLMQMQPGAEFRLPSFGDLGSEIAAAQRERTLSIGDLRLDWEAVQQTLQFSDGGGGGGGGGVSATSGQPGFWGWL